MFEFLRDTDNYEQRKVGKDEVMGLTVSTAFTSDMGYETAILDKSSVYPVERYESKEDAIQGHIRWMEEAVNLKEVEMLGYTSSNKTTKKVIRND